MANWIALPSNGLRPFFFVERKSNICIVYYLLSVQHYDVKGMDMEGYCHYNTDGISFFFIRFFFYFGGG